MPNSVRISNWKPFEKNTLRGFFTATLESGMIINDLMLHEKNGKRWIASFARDYQDARGDTQYSPIVTFVDRTHTDRFRELVLEALDQYFAKLANA